MSIHDVTRSWTDLDARELLAATDMVPAHPAGDIDAELRDAMMFNRTGCENRTMYSGSPMCCC